MVKLGYKLMAEEHGPTALVRNTVRAEQAGFAFAAISDHFFPWLDEQGHAPFAWSVLGAAAQATRRIELMTAVTCPIMR
jgi:alkanesulfonate monooxygenase SsuD/methylene tetrahydromethanopterin reductase-like flavin-dependent oxidoreductase (luciferase family)